MTPAVVARGRRAAVAITAALLATSCGVKAPPRPPLPPAAVASDGGTQAPPP